MRVYLSEHLSVCPKILVGDPVQHSDPEGLGQLARFALTGGQVHDVTQAQQLIAQIQPAVVLGDKTCDADALLAYIDSKDAKAVIPPKTNRKNHRTFDKHQYRNRNVIERILAKLNQFRRIATRYGKLASSSGSFIALAASVIWFQ